MPAGTEPHGAFTAALLQALQALPADTPASVVYERVKAVLEGSNVPDQEPDLDATAARREQPLFGGAAAKSDKVRAAALGTNDDGSVSLDIGRASGLGVGSEFTAAIANSTGPKVLLRITSLDGLARSSAEIVSPAGAKVSPGDLFELSKWIPADNPPLLVWLWPSNLSEDQIDAAAAQLQSSGAALVSDPAEQPWTHVLSWDGTNWTLQQAGSPTSTNLGAPLTADAVKKNLPPALSCGSIFRPRRSWPQRSRRPAPTAPFKSPAICLSRTTRSPASSPPMVRLTPGITRANCGWTALAQLRPAQPRLFGFLAVPVRTDGCPSAALPPSMPPATTEPLLVLLAKVTVARTG